VIFVIGAVLLWGWITANLVLAVPAAFLIWVGWLYVNPFTNCGWCKGTGKHKLSSRKTFGDCWNPRCQRGTVQRLGSKTVHRSKRALIDYRRKGH